MPAEVYAYLVGKRLTMKQQIDFKPKLFNLQVLPNLLECIKSLDESKAYTLTIETKTSKRSKNANAYMWELCEQIAEAVKVDKLEIYRKAIKDVGVYQQVEINEKAVNTLIHSWGLHGIGWIAEIVDYAEKDGFKIVNLYYGSSVYNTKQMSRLLDYIIQDAQAVGIETMTPQELSLLKEE